MNLFFLSLAIIFCGGLLTLVFWRQFILMKSIGVIGIAGGCSLGLIDAGTKLFSPTPATVAFAYLRTFSLSFQIDALSAFFLIAIYLICLLAALYSYHYMNNSRKAFRTAGKRFDKRLELRTFLPGLQFRRQRADQPTGSQRNRPVYAGC